MTWTRNTSSDIIGDEEAEATGGGEYCRKMATENVDYEKQFQEDLERAQALSLESLALEQFRNQKRLQELDISTKNVSNKSKLNKNSSVLRTASMSESDCGPVRPERHQIKPRPRPGTTPIGGQSGSIIAPPPSTQRRCSTTCTSTGTSSQDLISFTSPPTNNMIDFYDGINSINNGRLISQTSVNPNSLQGNTASPFRTQPINVLNSLLSSTQTPYRLHSWQMNSSFGNISPVSSNVNINQNAFQTNLTSSSVNTSRIGWNIPKTSTPSTEISPDTDLSAQKAPALPPRNKQSTPPPIVVSSSSRFEDKNSVRVSILEAFDPLLISSCSGKLSPECPGDDTSSICDSVYDEYDPYDFIHSGSGANSTSDPMYAAVIKSKPENASMSPSCTLSRRAQCTMERQKSKDLLIQKKSFLYDNISLVEQVNGTNDSDLEAFYKMVLNVRNNFRHDDPDTNMGLIISPLMAHQYREETSIKVCIYPHYDGADSSKPVIFTCDVTSSVEHITLHVTCELEAPTADEYTLKVWGYNEYLAPTTLLSDYEYVHNCIKLEEDVLLILIPDKAVDRSFARTAQDDNRDKEIKFQDIIPNEITFPLTYDNLKILLETLEKEMEKLQQAAAQIDKNNTPNTMPLLQPSGVIQSIKLVVKLLGTVETLDITEALDYLNECCQRFIPPPNHGKNWMNESVSTTISIICDKVRFAIQGLLEMYCQAFYVNFKLNSHNSDRTSIISSTEVLESVLIRVCAVHRPLLDWKHDDFIVAAQVYHGTRPLGQPVLSQSCAITKSLYSRILFNCWLEMEDVPISSLAREARLVLVLYGRTLQQQDSNDSGNVPQYKEEELGWAAVQFFNYEGYMVQGSLLLSIWPKESNYIYGPAPSAGIHPYYDHAVLGIEITGSPKTIFPTVPQLSPSQVTKGDFSSLDLQTQQQLLEISEQDMLFKAPTEVREVLWEKRHYLYNIPSALPKVLLAAHSWEWAFLPDLHGILSCWKPMSPIQAIQLLLPTFPDMEVRKLAVKWLRGIGSDELVDYLPQLVVALRHETYENSPLAQFLLDRSLRSPRVAHHLFWLLSHNLPGDMPQNWTSEVLEKDSMVISEARYHRRITLLLRTLLAICGESLRRCFLSQQLLVKELNEVAINVQKTKDSQRLTVMCNALETIHQNLIDNTTSLPLSPTLQVSGIQVRSCSYFPSNTLPLKINFLARDGSVIPAIYKVGDDLQQDQLTLQIVRIMDKMWLKQGLDLKMVTFLCIPTGKQRGMIEMVTKAETLRKIQVEHGLTGSFKDKPIAEWLAKHNPSELEYGRAVENFTASCAGYCVVTYVLGVCDRHNDNIMLKTSGHLFHIDFGKFLGDAQMFGNFKRDRTPFVLTSDMAYVINGCDRPSEKFHKFVDLCCQAFNIVRNNGNLFLHLFTLMASSGIRGVTTEAVSNLHKALLPGQSNPEAAAYFARLIESSLKSWFTQVNFFLHNLAQLKFTGDHGDNQLLSFVPKTYSMITDGRLTHVSVRGYRKRYDPDKYYVYILQVERENQGQHMDVLRTYKEFCELHQKLCLHFPLAKLHSLSTGLHMGRSNIKQVAAKRLQDVSLFVQSLFQTADEIAHSDLVYTFFHPLLRDQQIPDQFSKKVKDRRLDERNDVGKLKGQLKLSTHFNRGIFTVMVHHARGLPLVGNAQEPSTYVKVYLQPDPTKTTKRKTKVVKRNCHPSFMEMLEYRMALDIIRQRTLKATVWNHDPLQENEFLGGVELNLSQFDLGVEMTEWYPLTNLSR
ncbi:hypothetical protein RN001_006470 [Aquatica leii]|uniref:Phosphatidylinositol-4-phosphate 3-kinase n=1 Tax=Aquatica leii TaxID=1421715 RepID=A0AAN7PIM0_9COLE|nr:hypothetical protein RN001_006470 [Aquatica leii]